MLRYLSSAAVLLGAFSAQAQVNNQVYWETDSIRISVNQPNSTFSHVAKFKQILRTTTTYDCSGMVDDGTGHWEQQTHEVIVKCSGGTGKSEAWDAFFSAKKDKKADRLVEAIKGIKKNAAESLLEAGFFSSKPRSWEAFSSQIKQAATNGVIKRETASMVLGKFASENRESLGYNNGDCQTRTVTEDVWVSNAYYKQQTCTDVQENVVDIKNMNFTILVSNADLLPQEQEEITLTLGVNDEDIRASKGYYNRYGLGVERHGDDMVIHLSGQARNLVDLPKTVIQSVQFNYVVTQQSGLLAINVDPRFLADSSGSGDLVMTYTLRTCKPFFGMCMLTFGQKEAPVKIPVTQGHTEVSIPVPTGYRADVLIEISKENSRYYNPSAVEQTSDAIKAK